MDRWITDGQMYVDGGMEGWRDGGMDGLDRMLHG